MGRLHIRTLVLGILVGAMAVDTLRGHATEVVIEFVVFWLRFFFTRGLDDGL